jgi:hypothetical protein
LIYSPALAFVGYGLWRGLREKGNRLLTGVLAAGCVGQLALMSLWRGWFGGWSYGPRLLAEAMPAAVALLALGADRIWARVPWRAALIGLTVVSILIASLGCYVGVDDWHIRQERVLGRPLGRAVWDWNECQVLYQTRKLLDMVDEPPAQPASAPGREPGP